MVSYEKGEKDPQIRENKEALIKQIINLKKCLLKCWDLSVEWSET